MDERQEAEHCSAGLLRSCLLLNLKLAEKGLLAEPQSHSRPGLPAWRMVNLRPANSRKPNKKRQQVHQVKEGFSWRFFQ